MGGLGDIYYDGEFPWASGSIGKKRRYKTKGNLQVFTKDPDAAELYHFEANSVDIYIEK